MMTEDFSISLASDRTVQQHTWPVPTFFQLDGSRKHPLKSKSKSIQLPLLVQPSINPQEIARAAQAEPKRIRHSLPDLDQDLNPAYTRSDLSSHTIASHPLQGASNRLLGTPYQSDSFHPTRAFGEVVPTDRSRAPARPSWWQDPQGSALSSSCSSPATVGLSGDHFIQIERFHQRNDIDPDPSIAAVVPGYTWIVPGPYSNYSGESCIKTGSVYSPQLNSGYIGPIRHKSIKDLKRIDNMDVLDVSPPSSKRSTGQSAHRPRRKLKQLVHDDMTAEDRPAICRYNPIHPDYCRALSAGEIPDHIRCTKRFTRKSDCARHERIHTNHR